jgi:hypothetical protein
MLSSSAVTTTATAYSLEGAILDACDRRPRDPGLSAVPQPPSHSVTAWIVERGVVASVDVSGLVLVSVWERFPGGPVRRLVLLDERSTPEQVRAILDLVQGRLGTLGRFASPVDEDLGVYQVPVAWELPPGRAVVRVPGHLELVVRDDSSDMAVNIPEYDLAWRVDAGDALRGEIHVAGRVAEP